MIIAPMCAVISAQRNGVHLVDAVIHGLREYHVKISHCNLRKENIESNEI
jgi:hypothetical protein